MKKILNITATIAAVFIPVCVAISFFHMEKLIARIPFSDAVFGIIQIIALIGFVYILIHLWRSKETTDSKLYYTVLGVFFLGIAFSFYWFSKGLKSESKSTEIQI